MQSLPQRDDIHLSDEDESDAEGDADSALAEEDGATPPKRSKQEVGSHLHGLVPSIVTGGSVVMPSAFSAICGAGGRQTTTRARTMLLLPRC